MSNSFATPPNNQSPEATPISNDLDNWPAEIDHFIRLIKLSTLSTEIDRLTRPPEMPRRVELCREALKLVERERNPGLWASLQNGLANSLRENPLGSRALNIEEAISHYRLALQVYTRQAAPSDWAMTMNNLAIAYSDRIRGERADNLEEAIEHHKLALQVYTRQATPSDWAMIMNKLAATYLYRITGERADNLEEAIFHAKQALQVRTRQATPEKWAATMNNLAIAYKERIRGERALNLEDAIFHYKQVLTVYTRQAFPSQWAITMNNLANAYRNRIRGERALNIEYAISHYKLALTVRTRQAFPSQWAQTQNNLAIAYSNRIRGEQALNIEEAISHYKLALTVRTRQAFPSQWAQTQNDLATAYSNRIRGERAENLEQAIFHAKQALTVRTRQATPFDWAQSCHNLAVAYFKRIRGERAENIEKAISHYKLALTVRTYQAFPFDWAHSCNNLAGAYSYRIKGERALNIEQAIKHATQALTVRTPETLPQGGRDTAYWLGLLLYDEGCFSEARQAFVTAHEAVEALRDEVAREGAKKELAKENADLYARLVYCCLRDKDEKAAFEYAAAGKGRAFVDLLASTRFNLKDLAAKDEAFAKDWQPYQEIRQEIDNLRNLLSGEQAWLEKTDEKRDPKEVRAQLREELRAQQKEALDLWEELSYNYPALTATQSAASLSLEQAQQLATELDATLVEYFRHAEGWCAFVVTKDELRHVPLEGMDKEFWKEMVVDWFNKLADPRLHTDESYYTLEEWYDLLITPLELPKTGRLLLAPTGPLHLMPLAIAHHPESENYLYEQYDLTFAPNLSMVRVTLAEAKKATAATTGTLLTVAYPSTGERYLSAVIPEAEAVASRFSQPTKLYKQQATPDAVIEHAPQKEVVHFSCHAGFDLEHPTESGFELADGHLTIQQIITQLRLKETRLATLSACLTHFTEAEAGDELTGLTQALMVAGAKSIVASLWSVEQDSTRALFEVFYQAVAEGEAPTIALKQAMQHVRQQPGWEHPYYWAAFQVSGLGF